MNFASTEWGEASQPCDISTTTWSTLSDITTLYPAHCLESDDSVSTSIGYLGAEQGHGSGDSSSSQQGSPRPDSPTLGYLQRPFPLPTMAAQPVNELLSTQKSSDGLQITLHPLPILEISDHIIRSYQRGHKGAIVGALLGQQNGRAITIEHSFSAGATFQSRELKYELERESFSARLEQCKWKVTFPTSASSLLTFLAVQ